MHAFFTGFLLKLAGHEKWFDLLYSAREELVAILKRVKTEHKAVRNDRAKRAIIRFRELPPLKKARFSEKLEQV